MLDRPRDTLRPYQSDLVDQAEAALAKRASVLLQLPTGGGKTHIASELTRRMVEHGRVWFVCHRREILRQTSASLTNAGLRHGVVTARQTMETLGLLVEPAALVQICTIESLARRHEGMNAPSLIIWDECHHAAANSWASIRKRFPSAKHIGLSATPARLDGVGLGAWFDRIICGPSTRELIEQRHLSPFRIFAPTIPDLRGVTMRAGDYAREQLDKAMRPVIVGDVIEHYRRLTPGARAIVFAVSVEASRAVADRFRAADIPSVHVDAETAPAEREAALSALAEGRIKVLTNVELFTEGFDLPAIDAVVLLRPTKSLALYLQMIGRGLRTATGKFETIILDHAGLVHEHGMPDEKLEWSLDGVRRSAARSVSGKDDGAPSRLRRCPACTAVHEWSANCPTCSHLYSPHDLSINEVYGTLQEVRLNPNLCTIGVFASMIGKSKPTVCRYVSKGMPHVGSLIETEPALTWYNETKPFLRGLKGEDSRFNKLKESDVQTILLSVESTKCLAKKFNVSTGLIRSIRKRDIWKHL